MFPWILEGLERKILFFVVSELEPQNLKFAPRHIPEAHPLESLELSPLLDVRGNLFARQKRSMLLPRSPVTYILGSCP